MSLNSPTKENTTNEESDADVGNLLDHYETDDIEELDFWSYLQKCEDKINEKEANKIESPSKAASSDDEIIILSEISGDEMSVKEPDDDLSEISSLSSIPVASPPHKNTDDKIEKALSEVSEISLSEVSEDEMSYSPISAPAPDVDKVVLLKDESFKPDPYFSKASCDITKIKEDEGYQEVSDNVEREDLIKQMSVREKIISILLNQVHKLIDRGKEGEYKMHRAHCTITSLQTKVHSLEDQCKKLPVKKPSLSYHETVNYSSHSLRPYASDLLTGKYKKKSYTTSHFEQQPSSRYKKYREAYEQMRPKRLPKHREMNSYKQALTTLKTVEPRKVYKDRSTNGIHLIGHSWVATLRDNNHAAQRVRLETSHSQSVDMKRVLSDAGKGCYAVSSNVMVFSILSYAFKPLQLENKKLLIPNKDFQFEYWRKWITSLHLNLRTANPKCTLYVFIPPRINAYAINRRLCPKVDDFADEYPELMQENLEDYSEKLSMLFSTLPNLPKNDSSFVIFDGGKLIRTDPKDTSNPLCFDKGTPNKVYCKFFWEKVAKIIQAKK